jgi:hypothetical protein
MPRAVRLAIAGVVAVMLAVTFLVKHDSSRSALDTWMTKYHNPDVVVIKQDASRISGLDFKTSPQSIVSAVAKLGYDLTNMLENQPAAPEPTLRSTWNLVLAAGGTAASDYLEAFQSHSVAQFNADIAQAMTSVNQLIRLEGQFNTEARQLGFKTSG